MKLKQWLCGAAALAMLAACSDKDIAPGTEGGVNNVKGEGYVAVAIGMPVGASSRANDVFDDGLPAEYKVNKLGVIFFTGREENAKFYKAYDVTPNFSDLNPGNDQVTSIQRVAFKVDLTETSESLWALALVNYNNILSIDKTGKVTLKDKTVFDESKTIKDFLNLTTTESLSTVTSTDGFFMTNTPYTTAPGTGPYAPTGFVHLLAAVDKEKIMESETEAKNNPAAEIFVERAVAKIEVFQNSPDLTPNKMPDIESIEWVIDNTEPSTFVVRNLVESSDDATQAPYWLSYTHVQGFGKNPIAKYRFVGNQRFNFNSTDISPVDLDMYRIYFGVDPNGGGIEEGKSLVVHTDNDANIDAVFQGISTSAESKPQYCYENTFDVAHMDYRNTTRVILKVKFKDGIFFTRGIDRATRYEVNDAFATMAHFSIENSDVVAAWTEHFSTPQTITLTDLVYSYSNGVGSAKNNWINISLEVKDGRLLVSGIQLFDGKGQAESNKVPLKEGVDVNNVISDINKQVTFNAYTDGVSYYAVRIKHFGDDLTPWIEPKDANGKLLDTPDTAASYGPLGDSATKNYLGRYGVLRNNWYQLTIDEITKYGESSIGDLVLDGTPDDKNEPEQSISCKINILSWAKRTQHQDF